MARNDKLGTVATTVTRANGVLVVRYHSTDVVTYDEKTAMVTLRTGGYDTVTTRARMNQASNQFDLKFKVTRSRGKSWVEFNGKVFSLNGGVRFSLNTWGGVV